MPFTFERQFISDVILVETQAFLDERGLFLESFQRSSFSVHGIPHEFVQDNVSISKRGVVRGLHYQLHAHAQGKLVACLRGTVFDVAVDVRRGSPTFGQHVTAHLSSENRRLLWVPPGFAHGFQALEDDSLVLYKVTSEYAPQADRGIRWDDLTIHVNWPLPNPILSAKDLALPTLEQADLDFTYGGNE